MIKRVIQKYICRDIFGGVGNHASVIYTYTLYFPPYIRTFDDETLTLFSFQLSAVLGVPEVRVTRLFLHTQADQMQSIHIMYRYRHTFSNVKYDTYLNQDILHIWNILYLFLNIYICIYSTWLQVYQMHPYFYIHIKRLKFGFESGYRPQKVLTWSFWPDWTWGKGAPVATSPHDPWASSHWGLRLFGVCIWSMFLYGHECLFTHWSTKK